MPLGEKCGSSVSEGLTWTLYCRGFVRRRWNMPGKRSASTTRCSSWLLCRPTRLRDASINAAAFILLDPILLQRCATDPAVPSGPYEDC
ncbi:hypothetical protein MRX96_043095 [Rhipicephalus microplus]